MALIVEQYHPAFAVIVERYSNRFYAFCYRILWKREEAEEALQEAFLKLWTKAAQWDPRRKTRFTTWFFRVILHQCLDMKRKKRPLPSETIEQTAATGRNDEHAEQQRALYMALQKLPPNQMTAINLCFYEGLSNAEAADVMNIKVKALESLLMRGKASLRLKLGIES